MVSITANPLESDSKATDGKQSFNLDSTTVQQSGVPALVHGATLQQSEGGDLVKLSGMGKPHLQGHKPSNHKLCNLGKRSLL